MISVKIVLKDSWNIVLRTDEKLKQVSSLGEVTDPSVVRENLLVYFSETQFNSLKAYMHVSEK